MAAAQPDPEQVESLGPQQYPTIPAFDDATAAAGPIERRDGVKAALDLARGKGLNASGFFETGARWLAIANKKGNFGFHRATGRRVFDHDAHGRRHRLGLRAIGLAAAGRSRPVLARRACREQRPRRRQSPRELAPGAYTVILEPEAVADLLTVPALFAQRPHCRRGPQLLIEARRRHSPG